MNIVITVFYIQYFSKSFLGYNFLNVFTGTFLQDFNSSPRAFQSFYTFN